MGNLERGRKEQKGPQDFTPEKKKQLSELLREWADSQDVTAKVIPVLVPVKDMRVLFVAGNDESSEAQGSKKLQKESAEGSLREALDVLVLPYTNGFQTKAYEMSAVAREGNELVASKPTKLFKKKEKSQSFTWEDAEEVGAKRVISSNTLEITEREGVVSPKKYTRTFETATTAPAEMRIEFDGEYDTIRSIHFHWKPETGFELSLYLREKGKHTLADFVRDTYQTGPLDPLFRDQYDVREEDYSLSIETQTPAKVIATQVLSHETEPFGFTRGKETVISSFDYDGENDFFPRKITDKSGKRDYREHTNFDIDDISREKYLEFCREALSLIPTEEKKIIDLRKI